MIVFFLKSLETLSQGQEPADLLSTPQRRDTSNERHANHFERSTGPRLASIRNLSQKRSTWSLIFGSTAARAVFVNPVPKILFSRPWSTSELLSGRCSKGLHRRHDRRFPIFRQDLGVKLAFYKFRFEAIYLLMSRSARKTEMIRLYTDAGTCHQICRERKDHISGATLGGGGEDRLLRRGRRMLNLSFARAMDRELKDDGKRCCIYFSNRG